jgi:ketosteroid isomerase-like protein
MRTSLLAFAALLQIACDRSRLPASEAARSDAELGGVVAAFDSAWNAKDSGAAGRWLAPGYRYFSSRGRVVPRDEMLKDLMAPHYRLEYAERSEIEVATAGQTAVVSSRWRGRGTWQLTQFVDDQRCTLTLTRTPDGWRMLSEHCTQIAP